MVEVLCRLQHVMDCVEFLEDGVLCRLRHVLDCAEFKVEICVADVWRLLMLES